MNRIFAFLCLTIITGAAYGSNLVNPLTPIPEARIAVAASYHLGGYTITNRNIPAMLNRFHARLSYAPLSLLNIGFDAGASQAEVAGDTTRGDTLGIFHGAFAFSYGTHLKLATPLYFNDLIGLIAIAQATHFTSENEQGAVYRGYDGCGAAGVIVHIAGFGYAAAGAKAYLIQGENRGYNQNSYKEYSNSNNVRGWLAVDYFPRMQEVMTNKPFISFEVSLSPEAMLGGRAPVQELAFSIGIGSITPRLYGERSEIEWEP